MNKFVIAALLGAVTFQQVDTVSVVQKGKQQTPEEEKAAEMAQSRAFDAAQAAKKASVEAAVKAIEAGQAIVNKQ